MTPSATSQLVVLLVLLAVAAGSDLAFRRIPNWVSVAIVTTGVASGLANEGPRAALSAMLVALVALAILLVPWRVGLTGGADAKLAAAVAACIPTHRLVGFTLASALAGLVVALPHYRSMSRRITCALASADPASAAVTVARQSTRARHVPFGVAIAFGGAWTLLWR